MERRIEFEVVCFWIEEINFVFMSEPFFFR
jgi:hypothetical protein